MPASRLHVRGTELSRVQGEDRLGRWGRERDAVGRAQGLDSRHRVVFGERGEISRIIRP